MKDDNKITKFEFAEVLNEIAEQMGDEIDTQTIERMSKELNSRDNMISYDILKQLFATKLQFQVYDARDDRAERQKDEQIKWYLADFVFND